LAFLLVESRTMILKVKVYPKSKLEKIVKTQNEDLKVYLSEPPEKGKANKALIRILAEYFNVSKSRVVIKKGTKSRDKVIEILA